MSWPAIAAPQGLSGLVWVWLLHGLWLGTVAASLVALAFRACRHLTHRTRHLILVSAMLAIAIGPPVLTLIQRSQPILEPGGWLVITQPAARPAPAARALAEPQPRGNAKIATVDISWSGLSRRSIERWIDRATAYVQAARPIALGGWAVGVGVLAIVMGLGLRGLTKIVGRSVPVAPDVQGRADRLASDLGLRRPPVIRTTDRLDEPCVCGFVRIWILLPSQWLRTASHDSLDAVLAHELAHAKRRDHLANLAQRLVESLFFHHPAVHWLSRSLRQESEHCADAIAASLTGSPLSLALALESVARLRFDHRAGKSRRYWSSLGGDPHSLLLPRIQELIGMKPIPPTPRLWPLATLPASLAFALAAFSIGFAQESVKPPTKTQESPSPLPTPPKADPLEANVTFDVTFIDVEAEHWENVAERSLKNSWKEQTASATFWIINEPKRKALIKELHAEASTNVLAAPKVTSFDKAKATIISSYADDQSSEQAKIEDAPDKGHGEAEMKGMQIDLIGSLQPTEIRASFDSADGKHLLVGRLNPSPILTTIEVSNTTWMSRHLNQNNSLPPVKNKDKLFKLSKEIPDGSSLVVHLGKCPRLDQKSPTNTHRVIIVGVKDPAFATQDATPAQNAKPEANPQ